MKRRKHSLEFKKEVAGAILNGKMTRAEAEKKYKLSSSVVSTWVKKAEGGTLVERVPKAKRGVLVLESKPLVAADVAHAMRDATLFLRQAKKELMVGIRSGRINDLDQAHLLSLMALNSLQGN